MISGPSGRCPFHWLVKVTYSDLPNLSTRRKLKSQYFADGVSGEHYPATLWRFCSLMPFKMFYLKLLACVVDDMQNSRPCIVYLNYLLIFSVMYKST